MAVRLGVGQWFGKVDRTAQIGGVHLQIVTHEVARDVEPHEHARAYITCLVSGSYQETHAGVTMEYQPFGVAFHPANMVHGDRMGDATSLFAIVLDEEWEARIGRHFDTSTWHLELQDGEAVWLAVRLMHAFLNDELDALDVDATVAEMVGIALRLIERERPSREWVKDVKLYLREHFSDRVALEDLAARAGIHPASLARGFRLSEGATIGDYVSRLRVQHACKLLNDKELTIADVAAASGFADQSHLSRVFKALTGLPPGHFRAGIANTKVIV